MAAIGGPGNVARGVHEMSQGRFVGKLVLRGICCFGSCMVAAMEESELARWKSWCDGPGIKLRRDATRWADRMLREDMARWE
jgi:hypothetical protein